MQKTLSGNKGSRLGSTLKQAYSHSSSTLVWERLPWTAGVGRSVPIEVFLLLAWLLLLLGNNDWIDQISVYGYGLISDISLRYTVYGLRSTVYNRRVYHLPCESTVHAWAMNSSYFWAQLLLSEGYAVAVLPFTGVPDTCLILVFWKIDSTAIHYCSILLDFADILFKKTYRVQLETIQIQTARSTIILEYGRTIWVIFQRNSSNQKSIFHHYMKQMSFIASQNALKIITLVWETSLSKSFLSWIDQLHSSNPSSSVIIFEWRKWFTITSSYAQKTTTPYPLFLYTSSTQTRKLTS